MPELDKFAGLSELKKRPPKVEEPTLPKKTLSGKRNDPFRKQYSLLLKKETMDEAAHLMKTKHSGSDMSDLVQMLVERWVRSENGK